MPPVCDLKIKTAVHLCVTAVLLFVSPSADAAWTRDKGDWFIANSFSSYRTTHFVDDDGHHNPQPAFRKQEWNGYAEYGWRDGTTLGANIFAHRLSADSYHYSYTSNTAVMATEDNYGLADAEFFLRQRLWSGMLMGRNTAYALQPLIKLPSLYAYGGNPRSGTDNFDIELRLQTGSTFPLWGQHHFMTSDIAYRKRFGEWRDQFKADTTLGLRLDNRFMLLTQLYLTQRVEGNTRLINSNSAVNDYDLLKAQLSVVYRMDNGISLQMGGFKHLYARNTGDGEGLLFSIWQEF